MGVGTADRQLDKTDSYSMKYTLLDPSNYFLKLLADVESIAAKEVLLLQNNQCRGRAVSYFNDDGTPVIEYRNQYTEDDLIHELLHLKLWLSGFPSIQPEGFVKHYLEMMSHHAAFFPIMEQEGIDPKKGNEESWKSLFQQGRDSNSGIDGDKIQLALFALLYAKGKIECHEELINRELELYCSEPLVKAKIMGEAVEQELISNDLWDNDVVLRVLRKCLQILNVVGFDVISNPR